MEEICKKYKNLKYKNVFLFFIIIFVFFYVVNTSFGQKIINDLLEMGYFGSFFAGVLFVSTFTVVPASFILIKLAQIYNPFLIAIIAGLGAVLGDYLIFRFFKDKVFEEIKPVFMKLGGSKISRILSTPYFSWLPFVLGAFIIASPFPDEIGVGLMGLSKVNKWQFLTASFILNSLGILLIVEILK